MAVHFFYSTTTPSWTRTTPPFVATQLIITNDSGDGWVEFSFDGDTVHGAVQPGEVLTLDNSFQHVYVRDFVSGTAVDVRLWAVTT